MKQQKQDWSYWNREQKHGDPDFQLLKNILCFNCQEVYCMFEEISFPEHEYESIQNYLNKLGYCYTTRVYKEIGKYKAGELYTAPWGDVLKIDEVKTYWKVSDRPFYDEMNDDEKIEIRKYSEDIGLPYEFIKFSKSTPDTERR